MTRKTEFALAKSDFASALTGQGVFSDGRLYIKSGDKPVSVLPITSQKDFRDRLNFSFVDNSFELDNDRDELVALHDAIKQDVFNQNKKGFSPLYLFLQARTDFNQSALEHRVDKLVNRRGFNKQVLESASQSRTIYDTRQLEQEELAVWALQQRIRPEAYRVPSKGVYRPGLNYFNARKHTFDQVWISDIINPLQYKRQEKCLVCMWDESVVDHQACKKTPQYRGFVMRRSDARYKKHIKLWSRNFDFQYAVSQGKEYSLAFLK